MDANPREILRMLMEMSIIILFKHRHYKYHEFEITLQHHTNGHNVKIKMENLNLTNLYPRRQILRKINKTSI
jgi:hypothetical protein